MSKGKAGPNTELYKKLFKEADANGDGYLSVCELRDVMKRGGSKMSDRQVAETFIFFDGPTGDKRITFEEFCDGLDQILKFVSEVKRLFKEIDTSGDNYLDRNELKVLLEKSGRKFDESEVTMILKDADKNNDNKISLEEFIDACT